MKVDDMNDPEFQRQIEEWDRECTTYTGFGIGFTVNGDKVPIIVLPQYINNKTAYRDKDVNSFWWTATARGDIVVRVYLKIEFKNAGSFQFCFKPNDPEQAHFKAWLELLIASGGVLAIDDMTEPTIAVKDVDLDVPMLLLGKYVHVEQTKDGVVIVWGDLGK